MCVSSCLLWVFFSLPLEGKVDFGTHFACRKTDEVEKGD